MFTDLSKLSNCPELRSKQLKCLMSVDCIYEHILNTPYFIDLDRLESELVNTFSSIIKDIYSPIK